MLELSAHFFVIMFPLMMPGTAFGDKLEATAPMPRRIKMQEGNSFGKPELVIATFVNYGGYILPIGPVCSEGIKIALDAIQRASLLSRYQLVIDAHDEMCDHGAGVTMVARLLNSAANSSDNLAPLMIGPSCGENAYTGFYMKHYNVVGLADVSIIQEVFTNRPKYNSFYAIIPSFGIFYEAMPAFVKSNGWSRIFLLTETYSFWRPLEDVLEYNMAKVNISLAGTSVVLVPIGGLPAPEHFELAVHEITAFDPRIIIVHTNYGGMIACWLHRYGLYGPGYVYIFFGPSFFLPNSGLRAENCTDQMLSDVLQSVIYFSYGTPISLDSKAVDLLGTTGMDFEAALKERIMEPELDDKWFFWRTHCYSEVVAAALALHSTESELQSHNDTLLNWLATTEHFRSNGSYIQRVIQRNLDGLHYKGLNTYAKDGVNSRTGITGFFQMQLDLSYKDTMKTARDMTAAFKTVPIATYDSFSRNAAVVNGPGKYFWRTIDKQAPYDSLRIFTVKEPIIDSASNAVLIAIASFLLFVNCVFFILTIVRRRVPVVANSLPLLNLLILVGNACLLCFILILPAEGSQSSNINCIAASLFLVAGFSLTTCLVLVKLHIALVIVSRDMQSSSLKAFNRRTPKSGRGGVSRVTEKTIRDGKLNVPAGRVRGHLRIEETMPNRNPVFSTIDGKYLSKVMKRTLAVAINWVIMQLLLIVIWFGLEPPMVARVDRILDKSRGDVSVAYQHVTYACHLSMDSSISLGFLAILVACYFIVLLRSLYSAFFLRKTKLTVVEDLHLVRTSSYSIGIIVAAGAVVIGSIFTDDPGTLEIAVSGLAIIVVATITTLIFVPKLRKGTYL